MNTYFLDTSALVKRYHQEVGTEVIDKILGEEDKELFISDLSIIEFHSAITLKVRTREISRDAFSHLIGLFSNELDVGLYRVMRIDEAEKQEAVELLTKYGFGYALRTLDSLQLAAMESVGKANVDWVVCADARFCEVIRLQGFQVINPEESERNV
ncbi:putative nucleic acid-binding protein, contains PIN domain [Candidatus Methanophagaceae archaeon]|nr:putative nucleic acid-binding protein, contains PIN domain [Methanophagales archaeon]